MSEGPNTQGQLDIVNAMNKALTDQNAILQKIANALGGQASASQQVKQAQEDVTESTQRQIDTTRELNESMQENVGGSEGLAAALGRQSEATQSANDSLGGMSGLLGDGISALGIFTAAANGLGNAFDFVGGTFSLFQGGLTSILGIMGTGVKTVMGFFDGLFEQANKYGNQMAGAMFAANQDIIKEFGNLDATQGKFVKGLTDDLVPASKALEGANNSLWASIGNSAEIQKKMTEIAKGFGNDLVFLQDEIMGARNELLIMSKGMNLSADAMKNLGSIAKSSGGSLQDSLNEGMVASAHLSKQFDVDVKIIGKGISAMAGDMEKFGHLSTSELAAVATYSAKLGVEISALGSLMDKFDSFDSAAQSAGTLAEAFGMNIDAMAMMNAENPAERMDMLRQSLEDTGKSFDELSRHEKKLMAQTTGLDMKSLQNAMSVDVDEMGFDDFGDAAEEAAEKMTPEEAMQDVAKSIEKLSKALTQTTGGPLGKFIAGFMQVIDRSPEMRKLLTDVYAFLNEFFLLGREVGDLFMTFVRTNDGLLKQLHNLFDLKRIQAFKLEVKAAFQGFFDLLATDPKAAVEGLIDDLMKAVTNWAGDTQGAMGGLGDMLQNLVIGAIGLLHGMLPKLMTLLADYLVDFTTMLGDFLSGDNKTVSNVTDGIGGALMAAMEDIGKVWGDKLWPAISGLMEVLWDAAKPYVYKVLMVGLGIIFAKALLTAVASLAAGALVKGLAKGFGGILKSILGGASTELSGDDQPGSQAQGGLFSGFKNMIEKIKEISPTDIAWAGVNLVILAAFAAATIPIFAAGILVAAEVLKGVKWEDLAKVLVSTIVAVGATIALISAAELIPAESVGQALLGLLGGALVFAVGVVAFSLGIKAAALLMEGIEWDTLGKVIAGTIVGIIGTYALLLAATPMAAIAQSGLILPVLGGLLGAALVFSVGVVAFAAAINVAAGIMEQVKWEAMGKLFVAMAGALVLTGVFVAAGALLGSPGGLIAMGLATIGLPAAAAIFTGGAVLFAAGLVTVMEAIGVIDIKKAEQTLDVLTKAFVATAMMIELAKPYGGIFTDGGAEDIKEAMMKISEIGVSTFTSFVDIIKAVEALPIKDPKIFSLKMNAIGMMLQGTQALAQLGIDAMQMSTVASMFSDKGPEEMMTMISGFVTGTIDSIKGLVESFVTLAKGFTPEDLKGAQAIAQIIQAVASMATGLISPMAKILETNSGRWFGDNSKEQIKTLATGMGDILWELQWHLPKIVDGLITATDKIKDPKAFETKAKALAVGFKAIGAMSKGVGELYVMADSQTKWFSIGDSATTVLNDMFSMMTTVMAEGGAMRTMVSTMNSMISSTQFPAATESENFGKGVESVIGITERIIQFAEYYDSDRQAKMNELGTALKGWTDKSSDVWGPSDIVRFLVVEAKNISTAMKDLEIDLQEIALKPLMDDVLGAKGSRTFTIEPKGVNIQVNFNVTMDAEQLATQIVKGNQKNKKEGFFTLTTAAAGGGLEGTGTAGAE